MITKHYIRVYDNKKDESINLARFHQYKKNQKKDVYEYIKNFLKIYIKDETERLKNFTLLINLGVIDYENLTITYSYFKIKNKYEKGN